MTDTAGEVSQGSQYFGDITTSPELPTELRGKTEFARNEVVGALDSAFKKGLEKSVGKFLEDQRQGQIFEKWQRGEDLTDTEKNFLNGLDAKDKKRLSDYRIAHAGRRLTDINNGRDTFRHEIRKPDGTTLDILRNKHFNNPG